MSQEVKRAVLITGGSNGIGLALATVFAEHGHNLLLVARDANRLQTVAGELEKNFGITCDTIALDLSLDQSPYDLITLVNERHLTIDILVNNAGFGTWGNFWETSSQRSQEEMQLNMVTLALLTKYFVKEMVKQGNGKIMNVASTAAYQPGPLMAVYYATKAFVVSFSEALSKELQDTGVTVSALCPGPTETGFQQHAGMAKMHLLRKAFMMDARTVAECAYDGLIKGKRVIIPGLVNRIVAGSTKFIPKPWVLTTVIALHKRRG